MFFFGFSVQRRRTQILRIKTQDNITYPSLFMSRRFFSELWRDIKTQKSRLKHEIQFHLYYKSHSKLKRPRKTKIGTFEVIKVFESF